MEHFLNVGDKVEIRQSGQFFGKQVFVTKTQHRRNRYEVKGKEWFIARMFDRADLKLVARAIALPDIGTMLRTKQGLGEVVSHDDDRAVVNIQQGSTVTSTRLTAAECDRLMARSES